MTTTTETNAHITATATIVTAWLNTARPTGLTMTRDPATPADMEIMIAAVRRAMLADVEAPATVEIHEAKVTKAKSVTDHSVTCMCCGTTMLSLKRHLRVVHGLTPEAYREMWKLPATWPIVAPDYSKRRSQLAKDSGLGRK